MLYSQRNTGGYDSFKVMKDALGERVEARRIAAKREVKFDNTWRPILKGVGILAILGLSGWAAKENKDWWYDKCEQFRSYIGIPMSIPEAVENSIPELSGRGTR